MTTPARISRRRAFGLAGAGAVLAAGSAVAAPASPRAERPLAGKVAIVTGARANLGRRFAETLAALGADVVVHYHREATRDQAARTARLVEAAGARAALVAGDLGRPETARGVFDTAERAFGGTDIVVNNAGAIVKKPLADLTDADFERLDAVNNRGLFHMLREASRRLRDEGRIVNIATSLLAGAAPGYAGYAGTKAPVEEYTRMLAKEIGARGITVNAVAPGPVDTPFFHGQETEAAAAFAAGLAVTNRLGRVDDIAPLVGFLARPEAGWINGQTIWINGGYVTR
ncbi:MAG: SDR family oxidoreductase [Paracoccaceae bacterium]